MKFGTIEDSNAVLPIMEPRYRQESEHDSPPNACVERLQYKPA
jgi:hypothetical protein